MDEMSFEPLTPLSFLDRSAVVFGDRTAVVDGARSWTYAQLRDRTTRLAGALRRRGVEPGERVAVLSPNTHVLLEAHDGIPRAGAVLLALNTRLHPQELGYVIGHAEVRLLIHDASLSAEAAAAVAASGGSVETVAAGPGDAAYEGMLDSSDPLSEPVSDERGLLSLNYTSGTTGTPKGVMYQHRGAYLQALAMALHMRLDPATRYLWTLPMFHTNGWCFPWAVTAAGGVHVCLPRVDPAEIWRHLLDDEITHLCAAPTVLLSLAANRPEGARPRGPVHAGTGGAPPSPTLLQQMGELGIDVTHLYGLTETHGPAVLCQWRPEWDKEPAGERARRKARQGVGNIISSRLRVVDQNGSDVPADGSTLGELALRGNNLMLGYFRDEEGTSAAAPDGWFRTGDLGVVHPDGYVEIRDRAKDLIVSGGENIASVEVEQALMSHPAVLEAAVVAMPHERWGEVPAAFVELRPEADVTADDLIDHVRSHLARFKAPKIVEFGELPRTSTGKIQKYVLRRRASEQGERV